MNKFKVGDRVMSTVKPIITGRVKWITGDGRIIGIEGTPYGELSMYFKHISIKDYYGSF